MIDVVEILMHWYAGRPKVEVAQSLGVDPKTVRKYVGPAEAAGMCPGGPPVSEETWRAPGAGVVPAAGRHSAAAAVVVEDRPLSRPDRDAGGVVPVSVIHQRLVDEAGLEASVASLRRHVRAQFTEDARRGEVVLWRPPVDPGDEAQVDYGYLGT